MRNHDDERIYRSFEDFEREELRRMDGCGGYNEALDDMLIDEFDTRSMSDGGEEDERTAEAYAADDEE